MKTVVKTWRNRLPIVSDDLSHWSSVFMWRQHHYQGKPTWSGMPPPCNFPDTHCSGFMSWLCFSVCSFFCLFFLLPNLLFLGRCGRGGWYDEGKDEGGERGEEFPSLFPFSTQDRLAAKQLPVGTRGVDQWDQSSGSWPFCSEGPPTPKTCSRGAGWSLAQLPWAPLLLFLDLPGLFLSRAALAKRVALH